MQSSCLLSGCPDCPRSAPPPPPPPPVPMPKDPGDKIFGLKGSGKIKKLDIFGDIVFHD